MPPPGPRAHQAEPELLSAEAPSVLWKVPRPPVSHRAAVLGKLEGDAAHRSWLSPRLAPGCTWPPSRCLLLASQRVPCRGQEHPIPQAQHLSSPGRVPFIAERVLHPQDFVRDVCHGAPRPKRGRRHGYEGASVSLSRGTSSATAFPRR